MNASFFKENVKTVAVLCKMTVRYAYVIQLGHISTFTLTSKPRSTLTYLQAQVYTYFPPRSTLALTPTPYELYRENKKRAHLNDELI